MICFKVKNVFLSLSVAASFTILVLMAYYKYEVDFYSVPLFIVTLPIAALLLIFTFYQLNSVLYEKNVAVRVIYALDSKCNLVLAIVNTVLTVVFTAVIMIGLYIIQERKQHGQSNCNNLNILGY
jgi:hypothetical protein